MSSSMRMKLTRNKYEIFDRKFLKFGWNAASETKRGKIHLSKSQAYVKIYDCCLLLLFSIAQATVWHKDTCHGGTSVLEALASQSNFVGVSHEICRSVVKQCEHCENRSSGAKVGVKKVLTPVTNNLIWNHLQIDLVDFQSVPALHNNQIMYWVLAIIDVNSRYLILVCEIDIYLQTYIPFMSYEKMNVIQCEKNREGN